MPQASAVTSKRYTLTDFVAECREIVGQRSEPTQTVAALAKPLERIIARADCLSDLEPDGSADPERGFVIHRQSDFSILAVVWEPASGAPIHNHNSWAMEGVIRGLERNRNYQRTDAGSEPWRATLEELEPTIVGAGETTLLPAPPADIHAVEIPADETLAIHLYGVDILRQWRYEFDLESGAVTPFRMRTRRELSGQL